MTPFQEELYRLVQDIRKKTDPFTSPEQDAATDLQKIVEFANKWDFKTKFDVTRANTEKALKLAKRENQVSALNAYLSMAKEFIPIVDQAYIMLKHVDINSSLGRGAQLILSHMEDVFTSRGGTVIRPSIEDIFDPKIHKAVSAEEKPGHRGNTVSEIYRFGYTLFGKVIREAEVKVTCGPEKAT
jgi:molecular chaperone GrpE (heat shock protein)